MTTVRLGAPMAAALLVVAALGACKSNNTQYSSNGVDTTAASQTAAGKLDTAGTPANPSAMPTDSTGTTSKWSNPAVVGFAVAANTGEIDMGKLGEKKATNPAVKA